MRKSLVITSQEILLFATDLLGRASRILEIECLSGAGYHGGADTSGGVSIVGDGIDDRGRHRNFPYIGVFGRNARWPEPGPVRGVRIPAGKVPPCRCRCRRKATP